MTPEILPLLAASLACFSVLALFARHNRRTGWVKPRRYSLEELVKIEMDWKNYPAPVRNSVQAVQTASSEDINNFTLQLANFHDALAAAPSKPVEDRERVAV